MAFVMVGSAFLLVLALTVRMGWHGLHRLRRPDGDGRGRRVEFVMAVLAMPMFAAIAGATVIWGNR